MKNFWKNLKTPFTVLAPMEGVTDFVFREVVSNYLPKPDVFFTEFTNIDALNSTGYEKTIYRFKYSKSQKPIVAQIWGTNLDNYHKSAKLIEKLGFDGIDINMGCPDREVVKTGGGAALIKKTNLVKEIIKNHIVLYNHDVFINRVWRYYYERKERYKVYLYDFKKKYWE